LDFAVYFPLPFFDKLPVPFFMDGLEHTLTLLQHARQLEDWPQAKPQEQQE
jgi:hypothetical protein